jgi:hypothetical protein
MGTQVKHLTLRMLETQAQRCRIGYKAVNYYQQDWLTAEHPDDVYVIVTNGLRAEMKYHRTGFELKELDIDDTYTFPDKSHVTGGIRG